MTVSYSRIEYHNYCSQCKSELITAPERTNRYDETTGKPITQVTVYCPNKRWYNSHFKEDFEDGDMLIRYDY